jgi:hypothetical protein
MWIDEARRLEGGQYLDGARITSSPEATRYAVIAEEHETPASITRSMKPRLPFFEESADIIGADLFGSFKLAVLLRVHNCSAGVQHA